MSVRARAVQALDNEIIAAEDTVRRLRQLRALLTGGETRQVRDYDVPPASAEEIAARHGIELHPTDGEDTTPDWFRQRHAAATETSDG